MPGPRIRTLVLCLYKNFINEVRTEKMAEDDIYRNKAAYERFVNNLSDLLSISKGKGKSRVYVCRNKTNLKYFRKLFNYFELKDLSYVRRLRVIGSMKAIVHVIEKDLGKSDRDDVDRVVIFLHRTHVSPHSKRTFIRDIKLIWKILFPETDERGRIDDTVLVQRKLDKSDFCLSDNHLHAAVDFWSIYNGAPPQTPEFFKA